MLPIFRKKAKVVRISCLPKSNLKIPMPPVKPLKKNEVVQCPVCGNKITK
jgi:hypothetical protein